MKGVETARRTADAADPATLSGTLISIPVVTVWGFRSRNRYRPDRRDLNRGFPGNPSGSIASRIAFSVFERVIRRCEHLVDLHTGSDERANLPQIRVKLDDPASRGLALAFDVGVVLCGVEDVLGPEPQSPSDEDVAADSE